MGLINATPARVFHKLLRDLSLIGPLASSEWGGVYGLMPASGPSNFLSVITTSDVRLAKLPDGTVVRRWGVMVELRSDKQEDGVVKANAIIARLNQIKQTDNLTVAIDGHNYRVYNVSDAGGPNYVGENEYKLTASHTVNFLFQADQVT